MTAGAAQHASEVVRGERFEFGRNWQGFLSVLNPDRIARAEQSLKDMLNVDSLNGLSFLDIGSGSGLFSLAACRLGANVHSLDYDPDSVNCTKELRRRFFPDDAAWQVEHGSALDADYMGSLGRFDVVYAWGVLHHTGRMWDALSNAAVTVAPGGRLFIALYNDCGRESDLWRRLKRVYCSLPSFVRPLYAAAAIAPYELKEVVRNTLKGRPMDYVRSWTRYDACRGMSRWHDIVDWVGGYPYEVASVDAIVSFYGERGFTPERIASTAGLGCNEFVLRRST